MEVYGCLKTLKFRTIFNTDLQFLNPRFKFPEGKKKWSAQLGSCVCSLTNSSNPVQGEQWQMMQTWLPKAPSVIFYFLVTSSSFIDSLYFMTVFLKGYLKIFYVALWGILCEEVFFCSSSPLYGQKYVDYMFETC